MNDYYIQRFSNHIILVTHIRNNIATGRTVQDDKGRIVNSNNLFIYNLDYFDKLDRHSATLINLIKKQFESEMGNNE